MITKYEAITGNPNLGWSQKEIPAGQPGGPQAGGPTPEATFKIKIGELQDLHGKNNMGPAWGDDRIPLHVTEGDVFGRDLMYIHGGSLEHGDGTSWYTNGCIKIDNVHWPELSGLISGNFDPTISVKVNYSPMLGQPFHQ